jgi:hypothetical protein
VCSVPSVLQDKWYCSLFLRSPAEKLDLWNSVQIFPSWEKVGICDFFACSIYIKLGEEAVVTNYMLDQTTVFFSLVPNWLAYSASQQVKQSHPVGRKSKGFECSPTLSSSRGKLEVQEGDSF